MQQATQTFVRVVEVWVPDATGSLLEFGGGLYGKEGAFGAVSAAMCFGRGEGLPGQAWERGRPIMLKQLQGSYFRRGAAASAAGLTCAIALPFFVKEQLTAVLVIFCGDDLAHAGAIELWHNDASAGADMTLDDGYYGGTADIFEFISRQTAFRKGTGLPGIAWDAGLPIFMPDLGKGSRFLRADSAEKVGINRGFAFPCASSGPDTWVLAFLSALATPIVKRFERWLPDAQGRLHRHDGFCEAEQLLGAGDDPIDIEVGALGQALATGRPMLVDAATAQPGSVGAAARRARLHSLAALPIVRNGAVAAVVAWYF